MTILLLLFFLFRPLNIFAATPTPTSVANDPTPAADPTKTSGLDEIKKIREAVQQKVQEKLAEISNPEVNQKRGIIGKITKIDGLEITLEDNLLTSRKLSLTNDTVVIGINKNKSNLESLKVGVEILAMGYTTEDGSLDTKRIVIVDLKTIADPLNVTVGKIVDISRASPVFVLIPSSDKNTQYQIKTDAKTEITQLQKNKISFSDLKNGQRTILVFKPESKTSKSFYATKIINLDYQTPTPTPKS
ncbi:MAG: hypothetical protein WC841_02805 [Candidatus Shapirobacteria bacterium]|jgi:hypothetical protein